MEPTLMHMQLYGGPADGALLVFPLKPPGSTYLVRLPRAGAEGVWDVLAYEEAGRTDAQGHLVLRYTRYVGFQGLDGAIDQGMARREKGPLQQ